MKTTLNSRVRISHGSNKFVIDSNYKQHRSSCRSTWRTSVTTDCERFCNQIKGKRQNHNEENLLIYRASFRWMKGGLILNQGNILLSGPYDVSKKVINLLRHSQQVQREDDGTVYFWRIKENLQSQLPQIPHWSDNRWKACLAAGGGAKRRYQCCTDISGTIVYLWALQGHSGSNLIDPTLEDNVLIGSGIFPYIYHIGCAFNLQSIINNGLIPGGQDLSRRQTVFFLPVDPRDENHQDPEFFDFSVPRRARYLHSAWKKASRRSILGWYWFFDQRRINIISTRSNANILQGIPPAHCIPSFERLKTGEMLYERRYLSPRPPPKISLKHDHNWTTGNDQSGTTVEHQPVGKLVQQSFGEAPRAESSKPTQSKPNPICDRTVKTRGDGTCFCGERKKRPVHKRSMKNVCTKNLVLQIDQGTLISRLAWLKLTICLKTSELSKFTIDQGNLMSLTAQVHTQWKNNLLLKKIVTLHHLTRTTSSTVQPTRRTLISTSQGVPNSTVKRSHGVNDHNLIQKIENHPQREALQSDLQPTSSIQPFQQRITRCDQSCWEHWTMRDSRCWAKSTMQSMPGVLGRWHRLLHVRALLARWYNRKQEVHPVSSWPLFDSQLLHQERSTPQSPLREERKKGITSTSSPNQLKKKCKKREFLGIHDRFIRDARLRKTMIEMGRTEVIREMDKLANEDHTRHATEEEIKVYRSNWWIRSNFVGSDTMPVRHRADFKEALSTLRRLKNQEDQGYYQNWWQSSSSSWWNWQDSWWHSSYETSPRRWTQHWSTGENLRKQWLGQLFVEWSSKLIWCSITVIFGNSQQQFTVHRRVGVKSIPPHVEKNSTEHYDEKRRQQHGQWDQAWDQLQHEQQVKRQRAQHTHHLSMNAERALLYTCSSCLTPHWLKIWVLSFHLHSHPWAHLLESLLFFCFHLSFPVFFFSFHLLHCELYSELDKLIAMESCATPPTRWVTTLTDVHTSLTWGSCSTSHTSKTKEISWNDWWSGQWLISFSSNVNSSRQEAFFLYVFEDNEAVIKMIVKGRSPDNGDIPQSCSWLVVR